MAKYIKTIDLWDQTNVDAVVSGALKLQRGQWVTCGTGPKSRFIGVTVGGSVHLTHWQGCGSRTRAKFIDACNATKIGRNRSVVRPVI